MSTSRALRQAKRKVSRDDKELDNMRQEIKNLQETLITSLKKHVSNITLYMLVVILAQKIIPKGYTLYYDTPSLYANWTLYNNAQNLNQEIQTAIDNKTMEMSEIAVQLMSVRHAYFEDFEEVRRVLVLGHDCVQLSKRLKDHQGKILKDIFAVKMYKNTLIFQEMKWITRNLSKHWISCTKNCNA